jgi:antitoxin CcdA
MKMSFDPDARKRPVNLTLNEDLVLKARALTGNLSGAVEQLLKEFVERSEQERLAEIQAMQTTIATWNAFNDKVGAFADEYSTL